MKAKKRPKDEQPHTAMLTLGALGVVFGDIGTSPLYALRQCFKNLQGSPVDPASVLGILSMVFWSLVLVVCVKYLTFIVRANHEGEGGTLAMLALIQTKHPPKPAAPPGGLILLVLFGSALLYGDGVITPSISVLSAVEGLKIAAPGAGRLVVPVALGILAGLFILQRRGTGMVGNLFGPVMAVWFLAIAGLGMRGIVQAPQVVQALDPSEAFRFLIHHGWTGIVVLGAVVLCFSGAEALFADLSHFGLGPIRLGWYGLVLPSLVLNYFGQGASLLLHPGGAQAPFYALVPHALLYPMVGLATAATVIASQALISGVFTLTQQAIHMCYFPRFEVIHTSSEERGQVYIGSVNYLLMVACILIVLGFRSSENLGGAYGLAVIGTMTVTSLTYFVVLRQVWDWPKPAAGLLAGAFLLLDLSFLAGNTVKILHGAWVPLAIALGVFAIFWIWTAGHARFRRALDAWSMPIEEFHHQLKAGRHRHGGTGIFLTTHRDSIPLVGKNHWLLEHSRHEQVLLVTVEERKIPYVHETGMTRVEELGAGFWRVTASFGFMQRPDVTRALKCPHVKPLKLDWDRLVCYLPEATLVVKGGWWRQRIQQIFEFLGRNSLSVASYFRVPPREIIHVGVRLEM
jgi:KUP system potassium uptake protein